MPLLNRKPFYAFLFAAILLLGLALRLRGLDTTGLWGDQAFTLNTAMRWVNGGPLPLAARLVAGPAIRKTIAAPVGSPAWISAAAIGTLAVAQT